MENDKVLRLLGLCRGAGSLALGDSQTEDGIKRRRCHIVFIASDSGENTRDKFLRLCEQNGIHCVMCYNKKQLGESAGLAEKAVMGILSDDFASGIMAALQNK